MGFWEAKLGFIPGSISLECMLRTAAWLGLAGEAGVSSLLNALWSSSDLGPRSPIILRPHPNLAGLTP